MSWTFRRHRRQALGDRRVGHRRIVLGRAVRVGAHGEVDQKNDANDQRGRADHDPDRQLHRVGLDVRFDGVGMVLVHGFPSS